MHTHHTEHVTWLSVKDLAVRWSLSDRTIRRIPASRLPWAYLSRSRRYRLSDVLDYELKAFPPD